MVKVGTPAILGRFAISRGDGGRSRGSMSSHTSTSSSSARSPPQLPAASRSTERDALASRYEAVVAPPPPCHAPTRTITSSSALSPASSSSAALESRCRSATSSPGITMSTCPCASLSCARVTVIRRREANSSGTWTPCSITKMSFLLTPLRSVIAPSATTAMGRSRASRHMSASDSRSSASSVMTHTLGRGCSFVSLFIPQENKIAGMPATTN